MEAALLPPPKQWQGQQQGHWNFCLQSLQPADVNEKFILDRVPGSFSPFVFSDVGEVEELGSLHQNFF